MSRAPESILGAEDGAAYRRFLEWSPGAGFDLAIIKVALPVKRDALIAWTREQIPGAREIDLRQVGPERSRLWDLLRVAVHDHGASMLILYGLEESAVRERLLAQLNVERDELVKTFALPWILFVHPTVYPELMQKAPDFIDFAGVWLEEEQHERPATPKMEMPVARTEAVSEMEAPEARDLLTDAALAIAEWRLDEARDLLARYRLEQSSTTQEDLDGPLVQSLEALVDNRLDDALRLLREKVLPGFDRLEDKRAATMLYVAEILRQRGELDEALRILRAYLLPAFDRQGDARAHAVTLSYVADIVLACGDDDQALRLLQEEVLPVFEKLGDVRERAVAMGKVADILQARGDLDEALRIRREEELPVYEKLGSVHARAVTLAKAVDILEARGASDEALRVHSDEVLPMFEQLGDVRARAVALGKLADILEARRDYDEALRIYREESLPVLERLGDVRSLLVGRANLAMTLANRGRAEDAPEVARLLALALADARRLRLAPEAQQIETTIRTVGLDPNAPPFA